MRYASLSLDHLDRITATRTTHADLETSSKSLRFNVSRPRNDSVDVQLLCSALPLSELEVLTLTSDVFGINHMITLANDMPRLHTCDCAMSTALCTRCSHPASCFRAKATPEPWSHINWKFSNFVTSSCRPNRYSIVSFGRDAYVTAFVGSNATKLCTRNVPT